MSVHNVAAEDMQEVSVFALGLDPLTKSPVVLLKELDGERVLPIWIGVGEARAIAVELKKIDTKRPLTHELMKRFIDGLDARVVKVVVSGLEKGIFYAEVYLQGTESVVKIDARPSDSIALALRAGVPIYVAESVLSVKGTTGLASDEETRAQELRKRLQDISPEDFGKFTL